MKRTHFKGYTLYEIIAVIAILSIITTIILPRVLRHIEQAKESACFQNRTSLLRIYKMQKIINPSTSLQQIIDNENEFYYDQVNLCPSNGTYTLEEDEQGNFTITCSVHGTMYTVSSSDNSILYDFTTATNQILANSIQNTPYTDAFQLVSDEEGPQVLRNTNIKTDYDNRIYFTNPYSDSYRISAEVTLAPGENSSIEGYGILFETTTDKNGTDSGYIFQFDSGFDSLLIRPRQNGQEKNPITNSQVSPPSNDTDYWYEEHEITINVTKINNSQKSVQVTIDDYEIYDPPLIINALDQGTPNYTGFRTWGSSKIAAKNLKIDDLS